MGAGHSRVQAYGYGGYRKIGSVPSTRFRRRSSCSETSGSVFRGLLRLPRGGEREPEGARETVETSAHACSSDYALIAG